MMHFLTLAGRENPLGPWGSKLVSSMVNRVLWDHQGDKEQVPLPLPEALAIVAAVTEDSGVLMVGQNHAVKAVLVASPQLLAEEAGNCQSSGKAGREGEAGGQEAAATTGARTGARAAAT
ncbi:hypothetical protein ABBQ38_003305 [Trebouxia sp. C0009 RCD-2024]